MQREGLKRLVAEDGTMKTSIRARGSTLLAAGLAVLAAGGPAFARPDTRAMSCVEAQALVGQNGAVVLTTGAHTYNRFVVNGLYCSYSEVPRLTYVPTRDERQCPVGYTCRQSNYDDMGMFIR
jgi:hypothetical protein